MHISAKITGIKYSPFLCRKLHTFDLSELDKALRKQRSYLGLMTKTKLRLVGGYPQKEQGHILMLVFMIRLVTLERK